MKIRTGQGVGRINLEIPWPERKYGAEYLKNRTLRENIATKTQPERAAHTRTLGY